MPSAEAHVQTERPGRYLVQLCRHFSHRGTIVLASAAALAVAVHLGLGGAVLAHLQGTGWVAGIALAVILVKVIAVGLITVSRRKASKID